MRCDLKLFLPIQLVDLKNFIAMLFFIIKLFYIRFCAYDGSKRIIGGFDALMYGICFGYIGILFIWASRRLDDEKANKALIEKFKVVVN
jgi:hypothetical protein